MALEDYLENIYIFGRANDFVRITDLAKKLNVKKPTVVEAIKKLQKMGFVLHEKYGEILLTQRGIEEASRVYAKHLTLFGFLKDVLGVSERLANKEACDLEHSLSEETAGSLKLFMEFTRLCPELKEILYNDFRKYRETGKIPVVCGEEDKKVFKKLAQLKPGNKAIIRQIQGEPSIKSRLLTMGIIPGEEIKVKAVAPFGDPVDIIIKGYHLSLRSNEANYIEVEEI